jgi:hypothetical protein
MDTLSIEQPTVTLSQRRLLGALLLTAVLGIGLGYVLYASAHRASGLQVGQITWQGTKSSAMCVKAPAAKRVCGQYVEGTGGYPIGARRVGDTFSYRVVERNVGGAQLVLIVSTAP